jgi:hypothetical protein
MDGMASILEAEQSLERVVDGEYPTKAGRHAAIIDFLMQEEHRSLAVKPIPPVRKYPPLEYFILRGASLETIHRFCEAFPEAVTQVPKGQTQPLWKACSLANYLEAGTVAYLASLNPDAVRWIDCYGDYPIGMLLRVVSPRFWSTSVDIRALVDAFPEGLTTKARGSLTPVFDLALHCDSPQFIDYVFTNVRLNTTTLKEYAATTITDGWSLEQVRAVSQLLPQLKTFSIQLGGYTKSLAFAVLLNSLQTNQSIENLTLGVGKRLLIQNESSRDALELFLAKNNCLGRFSLSILNQNDNMLSRERVSDDHLSSPIWGISRGLAEQLSTSKKLQWLQVTGLRVDPALLSESLADNQHLKHLHLENTVASNQRDVVAAVLIRVLEERNVTLETVTIVGSNVPAQEEMEKIWYYTRLNACGRRHLRDTCLLLSKFVSLLDHINTAPNFRRLKESSMARLNVRYGLLRESPGLWSSMAPDTNDTSSSARSCNNQRKRKLGAS